MKAWPIAVGAGLLTGVILLTRRERAVLPTQAPPPTPTYGEIDRVALAVPSGWRRVSSAEITAAPDLLAQARALRSTPGFSTMAYGTLSPFTASDGRVYATWIEQHYHEPGGAAKPWGYHHGVTLLAKT